jgi:short-subunit dehydrogenase
MTTPQNYAERYGPWALIVGGSEGMGEHLARQLGSAGVNLVLVARTPEALERTAATVRAETGVEVRTLALDIARPDMLEQIRALTDDVEVGLVVHNVGGGGGSGTFVKQPVEIALATIASNPIAQAKLAHHYGGAMAQRGRGGILFIGSMAGNAGGYGIAGYSAAKAYGQILAEALWAELEPLGVDVLAVPIGSADTPARRRSGVVDDPAMPVATPESVARFALENLANGPVQTMPSDAPFFKMITEMPRREAAKLLRGLMTRMAPEGI